MGAIAVEKAATAWDKCKAYLDTINHMIIFAVTIYITYLSWYMGPNNSTWHVWLCTIGYQLLMAEGILTMYSSNSWSRLHGRRTNSHLHWILQVFGAGFSLAGCWMEYKTRRRHFQGIHAMTGLISMCFLGISMLNGISAMWAKEMGKYIRPVWNKFFHNTLGILTFTIGMASLIYGYDTGRIIRNSTPEIRTGLKWAGALTTLLCLLGAMRSLYDQLLGIFKIEVKIPFFSKKM